MADGTIDVFVSYKREDRPRIAPLVDRLRAAGFRVWWDADIPGGAAWRPEIIRHLDAASCVIAVWSELAVSPAGEFVVEEASRARQRGVLLPIAIDAVDPPIGFGQLQTLDLIGWTGDEHDQRFADVVRASRSIIDGGPGPAPSKPPVRRRRRMVGASVLAGLTAAFALNVADMQSAVCGVPGLSTACGELGLGSMPSRTQKAAWLARPVGDCDWLRALVTREPKGPYAAEALRRLQSKRTMVEESWRPESRRMPMFVPRGTRPAPDRAAAEAEALVRADEAARQLCASYASDVFRVRSAAADRDAIEWHCDERRGGARCSIDGNARCDVDARHSVEREVCP